MNSYIKWIIPEGEVLKVVDSNGDIIWRKYYKVWIADLFSGPCTTTSYTSIIETFKYSINNGQTWITPQTGTFENSILDKYILVPADSNLKIKFELYADATTPNPGDYTVSCYLTDLNQHGVYDTIKQSWQNGTTDCDNYLNSENTVDTNAYFSFPNYDVSELSLTVNPNQDSILYLGWETGPSLTLPSWDIHSLGNSLENTSATISFTINDEDCYGWRVESSAYWAKLNGDSYIENTCTENIELNVSANASTSSRSVTITLRELSSNNIIDTCTFTQARGITGTLSWGTTIKTGINPRGEKFTLPFTSSNAGDITVTHNATGNWFTASIVGNVVRCAAEENYTGSTRRVVVKVTGTNAPSITMTIMQDSI